MAWQNGTIIPWSKNLSSFSDVKFFPRSSSLKHLVLCWMFPGCPRSADPPVKFLQFDFYHPRMRVGNVFSCFCVCVCVCLSVCPSVCLSVCMPVKAITFEPLHIETSFLVYRYIFTISRSSLSIKVIGLRSRSFEKNVNFYLFQHVNFFYIATNH